MRKLVGGLSRKTVQTNKQELVQVRLAHRYMAGLILNRKGKHSKQYLHTRLFQFLFLSTLCFIAKMHSAV